MSMYKKIGLAPGTLIYTGEHSSVNIKSEWIQYYPGGIVEEQFDSYSKESIPVDPKKVNWLNLIGLHDHGLVTQLGSDFRIHPLALEDALNTSELPKAEEFDDHLFVSLKMLSVHEESFLEEHISFILGDHFLISLQEKQGDVFESVRNRLRVAHGKIRSRGNDYLLYALLDTIVDNYFLVLDNLTSKIDVLEQSIIEDNHTNTLSEINELKKEQIKLRKYIIPFDLAIQSITKYESKFVSDEISHFFEDLKNHLNQIVMHLSEQRDALKSLTDLHISLLSNQMNQIMKVLTIVAAIFIPLTFLAGIYGMNFEQMPELSQPWAYPTLLGIMAFVAVSLIFWMKRKKWL